MMRVLGFLFFFLSCVLPATAANFDTPSTFRPNPETGTGLLAFDVLP
jgi:hypothetical protein